MENVFLIILQVQLVQGGFRHEIADVKMNSAMLEAMAQHIEDSIHITGVIESCAELPLRIHRVHVHETLPGLRLAILNEAQEDIRIQAELRIIGVIAMGITARRRQEEGLYIALKAFLGGICYWHSGTSRFPVTYS